MPVQVQLPGYNRNVIGENIANIANAGASAYHNYKQANLADEETKKAELQNKVLTQQADQGVAYKQAADTPGTPESNLLKAQHSLLRDAFQSSGVIKTKDGQTALSDWGKQISDKNVSGFKLDQTMQNSPAMKDVVDLIKSKNSAEAMGAKANAYTAVGMGRLDETRNQNAVQAGAAFEKDPILKSSKVSLNSLDRSLSILNNSTKPVTAKDLNLAYNDYINSVAAGGIATEGKIHRELPDTWAQSWNELKQKAGENDDLRKDPVGQQLIELLRNNIGTVRVDLGNAVANQAQNIAADFQSNTNPKVRETVSQKLKTYSAYGAAPAENTAGSGGGIAPPGGHTSVKQGDHTYNWNSKTGKYE